MKKVFVIVLCLGFSQHFLSQQSILLDSVYRHYFQDTREVPHLHLNKTSFLDGEEIWFQAYVLEQNSKKPHPTTTNLYVSILEESGKLKSQKLIKINKGVGRGNFYLDSTFTNSTYYIKASTNWMKNFEEDHSFTQKIELIRNNKVEKLENIEESDFFDFQVFPEGGHLVTETYSRIGVLIKDQNNKGQKITSGFLKEKKTGKILSKFTTNNFGLGSFFLKPEKNKDYYVEAILETGYLLKKEIPKSKAIGVSLQVKNLSKTFLELTLATNMATQNKIKDKQFTIWIHNTNNFYKRELKLSKGELVKTLFIKKALLPTGTNIITVFNNKNQPLAERVFFNYHKNLFARPTINHKVNSSDSLVVSITNTSNKKLYLSASLLPSSTIAYKPTQNIYDSFLLKPYVKGQIENIAYYFKNTNRKKLAELDILLLTQGWSKYKWESIFNKVQKLNYSFENGVDVTLKFNKKIKPNQSIIVISEENNIVQTLSQKDTFFILKNTFIKKGSNLNFGLKTKKNLLKIIPSLSFSNSQIRENLNLKNQPQKTRKELTISNFGRLAKGTEQLGEVVITTKVKKYDNEISGVASQLRRIQVKDLIVPKQSLAGLIQDLFDYYTNTERPIRSIFLNGNDLIPGDVESTSFDEIREIAIGVPAGSRYRELYIYTYSRREMNKKFKNLFPKTLTVGFASEKEYYQPKYPMYLSNTFKKYGAIHWKANVVIEPNATKEIKSYRYYQKEIQLTIEGFAEDGKLFVMQKLLE